MTNDIESIIATVSKTYGVPISALRGRSRRRRVSWPRQVAIALCRHLTDASLVEIGEAFNRDHTSVIYAIRRVRERLG